ncbi:MAG: hypothetical protein IPO80_04575 [Propionibacteriaceae bacterium]|nr:hypothetical protein [Propionibacteriaceae bacterium]
MGTWSALLGLANQWPYSVAQFTKLTDQALVGIGDKSENGFGLAERAYGAFKGDLVADLSIVLLVSYSAERKHVVP